MTHDDKTQAALDALRKAFQQTDRGVSGWLEGIGAIVADHRQVFLSALTEYAALKEQNKELLDALRLLRFNKITDGGKAHYRDVAERSGQQNPIEIADKAIARAEKGGV